MNMILTRAELEKWIDLKHARQKREALARFDMGAIKYGPCDLLSRSWPEEWHNEDIDGFNYRVFEEIRISRLREV